MKKEILFSSILLIGALFYQLDGIAQTAFYHVTTTSNTTGHITILDHPALNGNPNAIVFVSPVWKEQGDQNTTNAFGVQYNGSRWTIVNQNEAVMSAFPTERFRFTVMFFPVANANVFIHTVTDANQAAHLSILDHPLLNNNPTAVLTITQLYDVSNPHEIGVLYTNGRWAIFNQDQTTLPLNAKFNVMVGTGGIPTATTIQHVHTSTSKLGEPHSGYSILNYPAINDQSGWGLFVTRRFVGTYYSRGFNIWYDDPSPSDPYHYRDGKWFIYDSQNLAMPDSAAFNIVAVALENPTSVIREVVSTAGDFVRHVNFGNLHWTLGEPVVETFNSPNMRLTQGFHQVYYRVVSAEVTEYPNALLENQAPVAQVRLYPNPTAQHLTVETSYKGDFNIIVRDLNGKLLLQQIGNSDKTELNLDALPAGMYLVTINSKEKQVQTFKIQKLQF